MMMLERWNGLSERSRIGLGVLLIAILGMTIWLVQFVLKDDSVTLSGLSEFQKSRLITELEEKGAAYTLEGDGSLRVSKQLLGFSSAFVSQEASQRFTNKGFELFDNQDYAMTEQSRGITYLRAIQGELERTIASLEQVEAARVHLSYQKQALLSKREKPQTASVVLYPAQSRTLNANLIEGVQHMVATAVESVEVENVDVFDSRGQLLSADVDEGVALRRGVAEQLEQKVSTLLGVYYPRQDFRVAVSVEQGRKEKTVSEQRYLPAEGDKGFIKKESINSREATAAEGIGGPVNRQVEFLYGTRTEQTQISESEIHQLSVAIAVRQEIAPERLLKLQELVGAAVGFNASRGDVISIEGAVPALMSENVPDVPVKVAPPVKLGTQLPVAASAVSTTQYAQWAVVLLVALIVGAVVLIARSRRRAMQFQDWLEKELARESA